MSDKDMIDDECEEFETEVDLDATFDFPQVLTEHDVLGKHLIIAPEYANWLVCNEEEHKAFQFFRKGKSVQQVETLLSQTMSNTMEVISRLLAQVLGKKFLGDVNVRDDTALNFGLRLTDGCNLRCTTCCFNCTIAGPDECTFENWKRFLDALIDFPVESLIFTGGEPLFRPDCLQIILNAKKNGFGTILLTNGYLISKEAAKVIGENCDRVRVSIDGPDVETNDSVRGRGSFEKAISALRNLSQYNQCCLVIAMTPTPDTMLSFRSNLRQFADWVWREIRADIIFEMTATLLSGRCLPKMSPSEQDAFTRDVVALYDDHLEDGLIHKLAAANIEPNLRVLDCGFGKMVQVQANGTINLCSLSPEPIGNIKDIGENDGKEFVATILERRERFFDQTRVDKLVPCCNCDVRYFCGGKCRSKNMTLFGDFNSCVCDESHKNEIYEKLVLSNPYMIEPLSEL